MLFKLRTIPLAFAAAFRVVRAFFLGRPRFVPADVQLRRESICSACPYFVRDSRQCEVCTCFIPFKASLATETCPKKFW